MNYNDETLEHYGLEKTAGVSFSSKEANIYWDSGDFHVECVYKLNQSTFNGKFLVGLEAVVKKESFAVCQDWATSQQFAQVLTGKAGKPQVEATWSSASKPGELQTRCQVRIKAPGLGKENFVVGEYAALYFKRRGFKSTLLRWG